MEIGKLFWVCAEYDKLCRSADAENYERTDAHNAVMETFDRIGIDYEDREEAAYISNLLCGIRKVLRHNNSPILDLFMELELQESVLMIEMTGSEFMRLETSCPSQFDEVAELLGVKIMGFSAFEYVIMGKSWHDGYTLPWETAMAILEIVQERNEAIQALQAIEAKSFCNMNEKPVIAQSRLCKIFQIAHAALDKTRMKEPFKDREEASD